MADFDNGIPAQGTDVVDERLAGITLVTRSSTLNVPPAMTGVVVSKSEAYKLEAERISGVMVNKRMATGQNHAMFF